MFFDYPNTTENYYWVNSEKPWEKFQKTTLQKQRKCFDGIQFLLLRLDADLNFPVI